MTTYFREALGLDDKQEEMVTRIDRYNLPAAHTAERVISVPRPGIEEREDSWDGVFCIVNESSDQVPGWEWSEIDSPLYKTA